MTLQQYKQQKIEAFRDKFMYPCSGCTDPNSEGTHQMESIHHWDTSETKSFLSSVIDETARVTVEAVKVEKKKTPIPFRMRYHSKLQMQIYQDQEKDKMFNEAVAAQSTAAKQFLTSDSEVLGEGK